MSLECMSWAKRQRIAKPGAKLVLLCLADHASEKNEYRCWAGRKSISEEASMSVRAVTTHLNWLEENGFIKREQRFRNDGSQTTNYITLSMGSPSADSARGGEEIARPSADSAPREPVTNQVEQPNGCSYTSLGDEIRIAFDEFNDVAKDLDLPMARILSADRRRTIRTRLKECGGLDGWRMALEKIRGSPFCQGAGDKGWRIDMTALCQAKTFTRLMEGGYDSRPDNTANRFPDKRGSSPQDKQMAAFLSVGQERSGLD